MKADEDLDLRQEFIRLRQEESDALPTFARTLATARREAVDRPRPRRWGFTLAVPLAAAAALALWLVGSQYTTQTTTTPTEVALGTALEGWETPTDYLLDALGTNLLDTLPDLGDTDSYDVETTTDLEPRANSTAGGVRRYA
jgi:hypothetical protein